MEEVVVYNNYVCNYFLRWNKFLHSERVANMGCGLKHTVILLDDGTMVSCGSNEKGQLGQDGPSTRSHELTVWLVSCVQTLLLFGAVYVLYVHTLQNYWW